MKVRPLRKINVLLSLLILISSAVSACSEYVHLWKPISEVRSLAFAPGGIALFVTGCLGNIIDNEPEWKVAINPESQMNQELAEQIRSSVKLLDKRFSWSDAGSPFDSKQSKATIWLDFVNPQRLTYLWNDQNRPPFAMFRTGEIDTARVRVVAVSSAGKVLLIDEFPYMFLLESDFMLPNWISSGGVWFRRVSLQTAQMSQRHEWTLAVPSDLEDYNQTPADIKRFYFGGIPNNNIQIYSNY